MLYVYRNNISYLYYFYLMFIIFIFIKTDDMYYKIKKRS